MRRHAFLIVSLLALLTSSTYALSIVPVFLNGGGQSWTVPERNVVNQAIQDWTSQFTGPNNSLTVAFTFDQLNGPLFQATANYASNPGDSVYPWSVQNITVTFNSRWMTLASDPTEIALRFTLTPPTSASFDGLTLTRNALGEILGFTTLYVDSYGGDPNDNKFQDLVSTTSSGPVFDPTGLDVPLSSTDIVALADPTDLMSNTFENGVREDISPIDDEILARAYGYTLAPEPTSLTLMTVGTLSLLIRRRKS